MVSLLRNPTFYMKWLIVFLIVIFSSQSALAQTSLDLSGAGGGSILLGSDSEICDGTKQGAIRFNSSSSCAEYCNGTVWVCPGTSSVSVDKIPDAFDFTDQTNLAGSTLVESDIVQITGLSSSASLSFPSGVSSYNLSISYDLSVSGDGSPQFRVCSDGSCSSVVSTWTSVAGSIENNQYLQLRATSNASPSSVHTIGATVSETAADWTITTGNCSAPTTTYSTPGTYTYTVPGGCTSAIISTYGAGGAGGSAGGGYGGGGGGSVVLRTSGSVLLAAAGGGGGGRQGGSGGGYAQSSVTVSGGESLTVYVGGGGQCGSSGGNYGDGGDYGGGTGSYSGTNSDSSLGFGGGAGSYTSGGDSIYGGGGGSYTLGGSSTYGGAGGGYDAVGSTVNGASPVGQNSSGGGGSGDSVTLGGSASGVSAGLAANSGPGDGGAYDCSGYAGDGEVVINPNP